METLDLHGIRHGEVARLVENFLYSNDMPVEIITGQSLKMKKIVSGVAKDFDLETINLNMHNTGRLTVIEPL
jgi:hypothetical protein